MNVRTSSWIALSLLALSVPSCFAERVNTADEVSAKSALGKLVQSKKPVPSEKREPSNKILKGIYDSLSEFQSDRALQQLAPLINAKAKSGLKTPSDRRVMSRLLTLAGYAFFVDENLIAGLNMFKTASKICPDDVLAKCFLANGYREVPDYAAEQNIVRELEALPDKEKTVFVYSTISRYYKRLGDFEKAVENLDKADRLDVDKQDACLQIYYARALLMNGYGSKAVERFRLAAERTENEYMRQIFLANADMVNLSDAAQEGHLLAASKIRPDDAIWKVKMADYKFTHGKEREAFALLQEALLCKRFSGSAYLKTARSLVAFKRYTEAQKAIEKFRDAARTTTESSVIEGEIKNARGLPALATKCYKRAIVLDPRHPGAYEGLTSHYITRLKEPKKAIPVSQSFVKEMPKYWAAHFLHARSFLANKNLSAAETEARSGLDLLVGPVDQLNVYASHESAKAHAIIGTKLYMDGDHDGALAEAKLFNQMKFNPDLPAYLKIVVLRPARLKFDDAAGLKDATARTALADMLFETRYVDECVNEYNKALKISPNDSEIRSYLMHVLSQKGDWTAAAKENFVFSQQVVNELPKKIEEMTQGKKGNKTAGSKKTEPAVEHNQD